MLLMEESESYTIYSEDERKEFLFLLFKHLQLGGRINQVCYSTLENGFMGCLLCYVRGFYWLV